MTMPILQPLSVSVDLSNWSEAYSRFRHAFVPQHYRGNPIRDLAEGTKLLLLYDEIGTGLAFRVWALDLYFDLPKAMRSNVAWHRLTSLGTFALFLWLPVGFAVGVVWFRGEQVHERPRVKSKKHAKTS